MRPLTDTRPKPLIELVDGVTILDLIVANARSAGVKRVWVVTRNYIDLFQEKCREISARSGIALQVHELSAPTHSSLETLQRALPLVSTPPAVFLGDDVTLTRSLAGLVERFRRLNPAILEAVVPDEDVASLQRTCSVTVDEGGWISAIVEKPRVPPTRVRGCGIYLLGPEAVERVTHPGPVPLAGITELVGAFASLRRAAYGYVDGTNINVNTLDDLRAATRAYANLPQDSGVRR